MELEIWQEYIEAFSYFREAAIRPGSEPRFLLGPKGSNKAVVLVHGLSDSPYTMGAVARHFHERLGYSVFLPLLHCHGLQNPKKMKGVSLEQWYKNVEFALYAATKHAKDVSIGGLSTGGALSFRFAAEHPLVTGDLFLFSAAFGLYDGPVDGFGKTLEKLLLSDFAFWFESRRELVGENPKNPYRYSRVPYIAARELVHLMRYNRALQATIRRNGKGFAVRVFSAWSEDDDVISLDELEAMADIVPANLYQTFVIDKKKKVPHASVVLKEPVYKKGKKGIGKPLEPENPLFAEMMEALTGFAKGR